jgi:hypothetical protein
MKENKLNVNYGLGLYTVAVSLLVEEAGVPGENHRPAPIR